MLSIINEAIRKLSNGKLVDYTPDLLAFEDQSRTVKCEWLRSGRLKLHGDTDHRWHYVETREAALDEPRTFTCPRKLLLQLPSIRHERNKDNPETVKDGA